MQRSFATQFLRCPVCRSERVLHLTETEENEIEIREGNLTCSVCRAQFPLHRGVGHLMRTPPEHVLREAAGLGRFAELMRADGWDREKIRRLPDIEDGYWYVQGHTLRQLLATIDFQPGQWLLDVGSNTCWASNQFATRGLRVVALDISTAEMQGLYTSDYFIEDGSSYFERVLGSMYDMPLASQSLDYVFCCEVLHHNDTASLRATFEEAFRVLKPGGRMLVANETIKTLRDPVGVHTEGVAQFEGYEHAFWALRYRWEATRAGFTTRVLEPGYNWFWSAPLPAQAPTVRLPRSRTLYELRTRPLGRRAYTAWLNHVRGGVQLNLVATKPGLLSRLSVRGSRRHMAPSG